MQPRIGIDVGGVIIDRVKNDHTDTSFFSDNYLATSAVPGAFNSIARLIRYFGAENVFIISKCGEVVENKTRHWLEHHGFYATTGFLPENVRFCRTRQEKLPLCRQLGITSMIDDRLEVLGYMIGFVPDLVLFQGYAGDLTERPDQLQQVHLVQTWEEAADHIIYLPLALGGEV